MAKEGQTEDLSSERHRNNHGGRCQITRSRQPLNGSGITPDSRFFGTSPIWDKKAGAALQI
jgi:hypothetical protein